MDTGAGDDEITGTNTGTNTNCWGIYNYSGNTIDTGDGNDIITGMGNEYGIFNIGTINTGNGADSIIADGDLNDLYNNGGVINMGDGNDSIMVEGTGTEYGIYNNGGVINMGDGNDSIMVEETGTGYGIYNSGVINMGDGNDSIIANEGFESGFNSSSSVFLGEGEDYIKSFGSGNFYGGNGNDTLELTSGTYTVGIWGEGGESPIFTKGHQLMITSEFEKLIAGGTIYDFTSLTAGQIIVVA